MFRPASVFPAPGTPVKKQIDFLCWALESSIILFIKIEVLERLIAPASLLEISLTLWPLYKA
tara:strand:- start:229 stop:414 length:186 start_codon:yes stop_codon:yes gene_type:complete